MERAENGLAYQTLGAGAPLLVMHGAGLDHHYLQPWLDPLGQRAELVYYDHRGCGASEEPADWAAVDVATWADDADALREHLGHEQVVVFGHSFGGLIALEYALRHPRRVRGLVLCGALANFHHVEESVANVQKRATPEQLEAIQRAFGAPVADDETLRDLWRSALPLYFRSLDPSVGESILETTCFKAGAFNRAMQELAPQIDLVPRLGEIDAPTLLLAGRHDWICPPEPCLDQLSEIPRSTKRVFEESGHCPFIEEADAFIDVVGSWLSE